MSGFFGVLRPDGAAINQEWLAQLAAKLSFRGPDGTNVRAQDGWGCSFAFLQTDPGRQALQQPVTLDGRFWLLGHVRLDARDALLHRLSGNGRSPVQGATDEDLLLLAWRQWGEVSLEDLLGDFSFALWDIVEKQLWCARDFIGAHPFFYAHAAGALYFSDTLQVLRAVPGISSRLDDLFIGDFLLDGLCADPTRTVYAGIRRLAPGHLLKYDGGRVEVQRFLQLPIEEPLHLRRPEEYTEAYRELLLQAVRDRMPDAAASLYLSGGLDSGSVCAIATQLASQRGQRECLKAFTVSWRTHFDDPEPEFAALTAKHLNLSHEVLEDASFVPYEPLKSGVKTTPEPDSDLFLARTARLFQKIASHARVVLSGDGGDDVLTGRAWPYFLYLQKRGDWTEIARTFGGYFWTHGTIPPLGGGFRTRLRCLLVGQDDRQGYPTWIAQDFELRAQLKDRWRQQSCAPVYEHPVHPHAYASLHSAYWAGVLEDEDAAWTGVPLEARAPLLDLRLLHFLLRLPPVPWCVNKELARQAMNGCLPDAVLQRPKTPLVMDPLEACQQKLDWTPVTSEPPEGILQYVNWPKYIETLEQVKGSLSLEILCPISLAHWLKDIENGEGIK
ncbi:MAG TPA: asparagine synthase-related protein [Candidatus Dormibacteraeota bacterium]|nr:asparagine synthase-related protein [Candidatus Dormibacteraeota bacterium]